MVAFGSERLLSAASIWACSVGHSLASAGPAAAAATTRAMTKLFISLPPWGLSTGPSDRMFVAIRERRHDASRTRAVKAGTHGRSLPNTPGARAYARAPDRLDSQRASSVQVLVRPPVHRDTPRHAVGEDVVG